VTDLADPQRIALLDTRPDRILPQLAQELRGLAATVGAGDLLTFRLGEVAFTLGRHEIPGLAMLFAEWDLDEHTRATAVARARGYLATATVVRGP
jgi:hypothetical protein